MILEGKYGKATVYTDMIESQAILQIVQMLNMPFTEGSKIAIMPDVHSGKGCTIGTTMTVHDKVVPNLVGVDIGCGVTFCEIEAEVGEKELKELDKVIYAYIPSGFDVRDKDWRKAHPGSKTGPDFWGLNGFEESDLKSLACTKNVSIDRAIASVGSLGGGNHYIECDKASDGKIWLAVHSGSRNLGTGAAEHYQKLATKQRRASGMRGFGEEVLKIKELYRDEPGKIEGAIAELKRNKKEEVPDDLCWLDSSDGSEYSDYLHDMAIIQKYAALNRLAMIHEISDRMSWKMGRTIETIHNYIDTENMILRKGAVSAQEGKLLVIPLNMRDGILICKGKGNPDWNYSAPHGAGRIMSRSAARKKLNMDEFTESMSGIYTTSVNTDTIDESPMAYKPADNIKEAVRDTVEILDTAKPIYNFKAAERGTYRKSKK